MSDARALRYGDAVPGPTPNSRTPDGRTPGARRWGALLYAAALVGAPLVAGCDAEPPVTSVGDLELPSDTEREADGLLREGRAMLASDENERAAAALESAWQKRPDHAVTARLLGRARLRLGDAAGASDALSAALEIEPDHLEGLEYLARSARSAGRLEPALEAATRWASLDESNADAWRELGEIRLALGRHKPAIRALGRAEKLRARDSGIRLALARALRLSGDLDKAERKLRDAIERDTRSGEAWLRLGALMSERGPDRRGDALDALRRAAELAPESFAARVQLYRVLRHAAHVDAEQRDTLRAEADTVYAEMLRLHTARQLARGGLLDMPGDEARSKLDGAALRATLAETPDDADARRRLGVLLHREGLYDDAHAEYRRLLAADGENALVHACSGAAYLAQGELQSAERALREALRRDPSLKFAWQGLGWLLVLDRRAQEAVDLYGPVIELYPDDRRSHGGRGVARMALGEVDEGLAELVAAGWVR